MGMSGVRVVSYDEAETTNLVRTTAKQGGGDSNEITGCK